MSSADYLDDITDAYMACALWASLGADDRPLDDTFTTDDIDPATALWMRRDCRAMLELAEQHGYTLERYAAADNTPLDEAAAQFGHDFWLTRCRHGAGFWDRGLGIMGDHLTTLAQQFPELTLLPDSDDDNHTIRSEYA